MITLEQIKKRIEFWAQHDVYDNKPDPSIPEDREIQLLFSAVQDVEKAFIRVVYNVDGDANEIHEVGVWLKNYINQMVSAIPRLGTTCEVIREINNRKVIQMPSPLNIQPMGHEDQAKSGG